MGANQITKQMIEGPVQSLDKAKTGQFLISFCKKALGKCSLNASRFLSFHLFSFFSFLSFFLGGGRLNIL